MTAVGTRVETQLRRLWEYWLVPVSAWGRYRWGTGQRLWLVGLLLFLCWDVSAQSLPDVLSGPKGDGEPVVLRAESLEFFRSEERLVATGNVVVESGETRMFADRLDMKTDTGVGIATGDVRFVTPEDNVRASQLEFNLSEERGILYNAEGTVGGVYQKSGASIYRKRSMTARSMIFIRPFCPIKSSAFAINNSRLNSKFSLPVDLANWPSIPSLSPLKTCRK